MSKNVVDSVIEVAEESNKSLALIPSRRQIDYSCGYSNNWNTSNWANYVRSRTDNVLLVRDHGGPGQGEEEDPGFDSLYHDCINMDIIHIDPWKAASSVDEGIEKTIRYLKFCHDQNPDIGFEVGTEQSIFRYDSKDLEKLLSSIKTALPNVFDKIYYSVIQSGTAIVGVKNTGSYSSDRLIEMVDVCKKFGILSKEHNGDYLPLHKIGERFGLGLDAINIAPELGVLETSVILDTIGNDKSLLTSFYDICQASGKWKKWLPNFIPNRRFQIGNMPYHEMRKLIKVCGHYVFSDKMFISLMWRLKYINSDIHKEIKDSLKNKIVELLGEVYED